MAIIDRSANNAFDLTNASTWVGSVPTATDVAKWGSIATNGNSANIATSKQFGAVWISSDMPGTTATVTGGGSWGSSQVAGAPNDRSLYIAANKIVAGPANYAFLGGTVGSIRNHDVEILSGGELQVNGRVIGALSGTGYNAVTKYGAGTMWFGRSATNMGTIGISSLTIREGTVKVGGAAGTDPIGTGTITFNATPGNTPTLAFEFFSTASRTLGNAISVSNSGTIQANAGMTGTLTGGASGAGTLTIGAGGGTLNFNSTISCPVNVAAGATLTMGASNNITGALTGTGTIAMNGGTINSNSPSFAGTISGNFSFAGGINALSGNITGTVTPTGGILTLSGTSSGYVGDLGFVVLYITGSFAGAGGTTNLTGPGGSAYLGIDGASAGLAASRTIAMRNNSTLALFSTASVGCPVTSTVDTTNSTIVVADATACTLSGNFSTNQASGSVIVEAAVGGTLTLPGSFTSTNASRAFALNEDTTHSPPTRPTVNIGGTIKVTGSGFSGAPATLKRGTLHLNSTSSVGVGTTLTVSGSGTTVACSSTGPYAAQITGNVSFGAGTTLRFGAP